MKYCTKCPIFFRSKKKTHCFAGIKNLELEPVIVGPGIKIDVQNPTEKTDKFHYRIMMTDIR